MCNSSRLPNSLLARMDRPIVLHHIDLARIRIGGDQLTIEPDHFLAPDDVGIQIIDATAQCIQGPNHAPLCVVRAIPVGLGRGCGRCWPPGTPVGRPALVAHLVQKHQHDVVRMRGGIAQTFQQMLQLRHVFRIGTMLAHLRRANVQAMAMQHPPHPTQRVVPQPGKRGAHTPQRPAARCWTVRRGRQLLPRFLARRVLQAVDNSHQPTRQRERTMRRFKSRSDCPRSCSVRTLSSKSAASVSICTLTGAGPPTIAAMPTRSLREAGTSLSSEGMERMGDREEAYISLI